MILVYDLVQLVIGRIATGCSDLLSRRGKDGKSLFSLDNSAALCDNLPPACERAPPSTACISTDLGLRLTLSMRVLLKWLGSISLIMMYILCACAIRALPAGPRMRRSLLLKNTALFAGLMLELLGIRVHHGRHKGLPKKTGRVLIVANHVSYIDVLVISSLFPAVFITSRELGGTLFLGMLARLGGSMFVERRKVGGLKKEIEEISRVLREGHPVVLFPEGTTSNGERVHPFRNALFDAAITADADILPLCLRYIRLNDETLTPKNRDRIFYYGGAVFSRHFPRLLSIASVEVEVLRLPIIRVNTRDSRKELAALAHDAVSKAYMG